jgi:hypothetical protein
MFLPQPSELGAVLEMQFSLAQHGIASIAESNLLSLPEFLWFYNRLGESLKAQNEEDAENPLSGLVDKFRFIRGRR